MKHFSLIYLASGFSKRFGSNKLLSVYKERKMFEYGLESLLCAAQKHNFNDEIIAVTQYQEIVEYAKAKNLKTVLNLNAKEGISESIKCGINASSVKSDAYLFLVADQPEIASDTVFSMMKYFEENECKILQAAVNVKDGNSIKKIYGNPVIFSSEYKKEFLELTGDTGGKQIIKKHPESTECFFIKNPDELKDIDFFNDIKS
ncbi:MAG: nucleotidyltransferase family protein [Treponema sp.]|nr:nucleotidyltransferase family protein [Candidatus Treponema merdequi]